ncbi:MAG: RNA 2',3'-cyclic phosphodiesterase [Aeromonas sp.]
MAKLFFALPIEEQAPDIIRWRDQQVWPGQPVPAVNLHLTLAFLGESDELTTLQLIAAASHQHCPPLRITLDEIGWFRRAKAAWIGPRAWPNELNVLARALRRHGERLGLELGNGNGERSFHPHVTLSRKATQAPATGAAPHIELTVSQFCLYQSVSCTEGVRYQPLACWPLRAREKVPT